MVRLTRIYTGGGDAGKTSLGDGGRIEKNAMRVEAYGTVDEANSAIGVARSHISGLRDPGGLDATLGRVQNDLFDLGADLCRPEPAPDAPAPEHPPLRVTPEQSRWLETEIDRLNGDLGPLESFVLPGGTPASAYLHLARTIVRRAERRTIGLMADEQVNPNAPVYLNRLSDLLFVSARWVNDRGAKDVLWTPGANR